MWTPSKGAVGFALAGCWIISCGSSSESVVGGNSGSGGKTSTGGSGAITGIGGSANTAGTGGSGAVSGSTFCVIGMKGCPCDSGVCASGLVCKNDTCCDGTDCSPPPTNIGTGGSAGAGGSGTSGASGTSPSADGSTCTPGVIGPVITDCGYPYASDNPLTNVVFNESEVLRGIEPSGGAPLASIRLFYNDEHALTLGVRHVDVIDSTGTAGRDYPVTPLNTNPGFSRYPQTGTNEVTGDYSGLDQSGRPMWPALFITDITDDPNSTSGDWQQGGTAYNPNAIYGTWKPAVRTVDKTVTPTLVSITPDADPTKNDWNLGGGDPVPSALLAINQGWSAEVRWDLVLVAGRSYRVQVLVHDGDQNKAGGDSGEACVNFCASASCPTGNPPCDASGACASATDICVHGCCIVGIPR